MTPSIPIADLRAADEETVLDALDSNIAADALHGIAPVVLLEFFQAMVDQLAPGAE